jgi:hypothetical protein
MLQDQSRNRTPMPAAQPPAVAARAKPRRARAEAGISRMLSEKAAPPKGSAQVPVPGSPEAIELFGVACRAVDLASLGDAAELEALRINDGCTLWTPSADLPRVIDDPDLGGLPDDAARIDLGKRCRHPPGVMPDTLTRSEEVGGGGSPGAVAHGVGLCWTKRWTISCPDGARFVKKRPLSRCLG